MSRCHGSGVPIWSGNCVPVRHGEVSKLPRPAPFRHPRSRAPSSPSKKRRLVGQLSLSFWEALIVEAALAAAGADRLLTEDLQHGQEIKGLKGLPVAQQLAQGSPRATTYSHPAKFPFQTPRCAAYTWSGGFSETEAALAGQPNAYLQRLSTFSSRPASSSKPGKVWLVLGNSEI